MPQWWDWDNRGGSMKFAPAASSWGPENVQYFMVDKGTSRVMMKETKGYGYGGWEDLGGTLTESPAVVCWGPGRIDLFGRGTDNALWWKFRENDRWSDWSSLGGTLTSAPAVASWGPGRLDVFARGTDNALWHIWYEGGRWSGWESLGGNLIGAPSALSQDRGHIVVLTRQEGALELQSLRFWNGRWEPWVPYGFGLPAAPALAAWGRDRIDLFHTEPDNRLYHRWFTAGKWSTFDLIGESIYSQPGAVAPGPNRLIVVARGPGDSLVDRRYF